jgi:hypothetical protein
MGIGVLVADTVGVAVAVAFAVSLAVGEGAWVGLPDAAGD